MSLHQFKDLLCKALKRGGQGYEFKDVEKAVASGDARFWPGIDSAAVTENVTSLSVWLYAGKLSENIDMEIALEAYARALGYDQITVPDPRKGWEKHLEKLGYKRQVVYVKGLKNV